MTNEKGIFRYLKASNILLNEFYIKISIRIFFIRNLQQNQLKLLKNMISFDIDKCKVNLSLQKCCWQHNVAKELMQ